MLDKTGLLKAHFLSEVKLNKCLWYFTGPPRQKLFSEDPRTKKELPISGLEQPTGHDVVTILADFKWVVESF